jgi:hypothetical protein
VILVLVRVQNVCALLIEQGRDPRHQAFPVRAVNQQYRRIFHRSFSLSHRRSFTLKGNRCLQHILNPPYVLRQTQKNAETNPVPAKRVQRHEL